ncbi:MAG: hypothetical protein FJX76_25160 [Armatimonadetes bacterium]|nr:hypothetical protein [Armatimonadota bacterium]
MNWWLMLAGTVITVTAIAHSYLGERHILIRLFRKDLPILFGSDWFTRRTLRFAWHLTTLAWIGFGQMLFSFAQIPIDRGAKLACDMIVGAAVLSGILTFGATDGRHRAWIAFFLVAFATYMGAIPR